MRPFVRVRGGVFAWLAAGLLAVAAPALAQSPQHGIPPRPEPLAPCAVQERELADAFAARRAAEQHAPVVPVAPPVPPADSPTLYRCATLVFYPENQSIIDQDTYTYYIKFLPSDVSNPLVPKWVPYDEDKVIDDFDSLLKTGFLDNLWVEQIDEPYSNGVKGVHIVFNMEERPRLKGIEYLGSKKVEVSKIEDQFKAKGVSLAIDSFIDMSNVRRAQTIIQELYAEKGYQAATVTPVLRPLEGSTKLVRLVFTIDEGPEVKIKKIVWDGNKAFSDGTLSAQMKDNRPVGWLSWLTSAGTYQESKFADDAQLVTEFYQNHGYMQAKVGTPQIVPLGDSKDGKQRMIELKIPVDEGQQFRLGKISVTGNTLFKPEVLVNALKMKEGDIIVRKKLVKGLEEIRKAYGRFGYWEANPAPLFCGRGTDCDTGQPLAPGPLPDIADVTIQANEGKQYFVDRITFTGNTTTHDTVIRREMHVVEGYVFDSVALQDSIKRINQLGYFKPLEKDEDIDVQPSKTKPNAVDIRLHFTEQNRNQLSFGAGVSQYEGVFGQLGFQTSNFLGRGETLGINLQKGSQARDYQVSFSEPWIFDRPITVGTDVYSREYIFISQYTEDQTGGDALASFSLGGYRRLSLSYGYTKFGISDVDPVYQTLIAPGHYDISKITPAFVYNTVDQPIFPNSGQRYTVSVGVAGLGGTYSFVSTNLEGIWYRRITPRRMSLGLHLQGTFSEPYGASTVLPVSERVYLGGEYTIRGFDLRSIGPRDNATGVVLGGNKTIVFNAEYYFNISSAVRFLLFYDAGEVRDIGQPFVLKDPILQAVAAPQPNLIDSNFGQLTYPGAPTSSVQRVGGASAIKTSTGVELRFFMPILNIPFRLIAAYNPQRYGVLNDKLQLTPQFTFRFAVGTTF